MEQGIEQVRKDIQKLRTLLELGKPVLNTDEAAAFMGVSRQYIYKLRAEHALPYYKSPKGGLYFKRSELEAWMTDRRYPSRKQLKDNPDKYLKN